MRSARPVKRTCWHEQLDYNSEAVRQGIERLKLLGKHSELLMHSYYGVPVDEAQLGGRTINQLIDANILRRLMSVQALNSVTLYAM